MTRPAGDRGSFEDTSFLLLIVIVTLAFWWILLPFYGAILWAIVGAVIFAPLYRRLLQSVLKPSLAATIAVLFITAIVILPLAMVTASLVREGTALYAKVQSGEINFGSYVQQVFNALPGSVRGLLERIDLTDLTTLREGLSSGLMKGGQVLAPRALSIGLNTFDFLLGLGIMLYLLFFLLRDGAYLADRLKRAIPLHEDQKAVLFSRFAVVVRATVKGGILVAIVQGALGGLAFWFVDVHAPLLWAVLMAFLSLLPAIGAGIVWLPVAVYFLATGSVWQGVFLIAWGVLVIGLVDNLLRPFLVGKDTKLPDYVVLLSTLGGIEVVGLNGFVIGPLVAAMFMVAWESFTDSRHAPLDER